MRVENGFSADGDMIGPEYSRPGLDGGMEGRKIAGGTLGMMAPEWWISKGKLPIIAIPHHPND
ncbi:MAG: hypothetical protein CMJ53_11765 [Planctomycetaceae bacterium]|nr:hypothetical protein [Planctomycetaceae bacterium]